ncbi:MAG: GMC family oxidoreductase N-terminal domain-containing protein, partial [Candidatus Binataceae bacterium]
VLERGKRWAKADFPRTLGQVAQAFWNHRDFGLLDYRVFGHIDVIQASGVGGGSLVYFNVHRRAKPRIFENPRWPRNVTREALDPFYDRAKEMLEARPLTPPDGLPLPHRTRALLEGARAAGHAPELLDICVYTGPPRNNPHSGLPQSACVYCGNCMLGCHVHAKNTLDLNYLPVAEKNGAEIRPLHEVVMIEPATEGYRIHFKQLNAGSAGAAESGSVIGRKVVVAAGTLGSTELLLRCRDVHRTLPRISNALGSKFSGNGDSLIPATTDLPQAIDAAWGPSITAGFGYSDGADELYIQDLGIPDPFFWTLQAGLPNATRLHNVWRVLKDYIARMLGRPSGKTEGVDFQKLFQGGLLHALPYLG